MRRLLNRFSQRELSFRLKLMLAMTTLAATVAFGSLWLAKHAMSQIYRGFLNEQFAQEVQRFQEREEARIAPVLEKVEVALSSVRLIAALEADSADTFFSDLRYELRGVLQSGSLANLRFLKTNGTILAPPAISVAHDPEHDVEALSPTPEPLAAVAFRLTAEMDLLKSTRIGYLTLPNAQGDRHGYRLISTPFMDQYEGRFLGALLFALPIPELEWAPEVKNERIKGALQIGDALYATRLHPTDQARMLPLLDQAASHSAPEISIGGEPHLAYFERLPNLPGFPSAHQVSLFSLAAFYRLLADVQWLVIGFGLSAIAVGLLLSLAFGHHIAQPLMRLAEGAQAVEAGKFDTQVAIRSRDELGRLAAAFNRMAQGLALKEKYRAVLGKVTDPEVAEALMAGNLTLGGEVRDVTVLFCDIRSFTSLTEGMPPGEVIELLNEHMTALTRVVYAHKGVVDKFVGDEIMVLFGAPRGFPEDAHNAAACALAMIAEREALNQNSRWNCQIGIGMASGEVVAGCMGSEDRLNYTVLGEQVNLAARLCGQALPGQVLLDPRTHERLGESFARESANILTLKGFEKPIPTWRLLPSPPALS